MNTETEILNRLQILSVNNGKKYNHNLKIIDNFIFEDTNLTVHF
jgi:hypothetical protein